MGKVLYQSMTRSEDEINIRKQIQPAPQQAIAYPVQPIIPPLPQKENISELNAVVPFEADFSDQEVPDFDLMALITDVQQDKMSPKKTSTQAVTTSNILNNVPKSMFSNCTIQNVTFNMPK